MPETTTRYVEAKGGRKTAHARARVLRGEQRLTVNELDYKQYFVAPRQQVVVAAPLTLTGLSDQLMVSVNVAGGGISAQAEAVRNAIARALVKLDEQLKPQLRAAGFITRDSRVVERKKYGLKKARRAPQWKKR